MAAKVRVRDRLFKEYVERLSRELGSVTIILFGSRARGTPLPFSDYDIAIVVPEDVCTDKLGVIERARSVKPPGLSVDIVVLCPSELRDPLTRSMLSNSIVLYDRLGVDLEDG